MLQVKQTLERLQLSSFNGQPNIPAGCLVRILVRTRLYMYEIFARSNFWQFFQ